MKLRASMPELDGATTWLNGQYNREELIGDKPTLIHFWSVSCYLCKEVMPEVNKFRDQYKDELNIIAVHMPLSDEDTNIKQIKKVAAQYNIHQPIYIDNDLKLADTFKTKYVPAYYVFDRSGVLRHYQSGDTGMKMLAKRVNRLIEEV